jgi:hypothetical protein
VIYRIHDSQLRMLLATAYKAGEETIETSVDWVKADRYAETVDLTGTETDQSAETVALNGITNTLKGIENKLETVQWLYDIISDDDFLKRVIGPLEGIHAALDSNVRYVKYK